MAHIEPSARIASHVLKEWLRVRVSPIFRKRYLLAGLKEHGRITFNHGGSEVEWHPRYRRRQIAAGPGNPTSITFPRTNTKVIAKLAWREYHMGESITKFEKLASQNKESSLFNIVTEVLGEVLDDFQEDFCDELYIDDSATGQSQQLAGFESWYAVHGTPVTLNSYVGRPWDTYAGLTTKLGDDGGYGGSWTPPTSELWPLGIGRPEYHFWSPLIVDYQNQNFSPTTAGEWHNWENQWQQALNFLRTFGGLLQKRDYDVILLDANLLRLAEDSLEDTQRWQLTEASEKKDVAVRQMMYDGTPIATEYGIPADVGYAFNWDKLELMSMQSQLIDQDEDKDITTATRLIALDAYVQLKCEAPSFTGKLAALSALGTY